MVRSTSATLTALLALAERNMYYGLVGISASHYKYASLAMAIRITIEFKSSEREHRHNTYIQFAV